MDTNTNFNQVPAEAPAEQPTLSWTASTQAQHQRSSRWYVYAGGFVLFCILYSIVTNAWSFTLVIILLAGLYAYVHKHEPAAQTITITQTGVQFGQEFISWFECKGFWMLQSQSYVELHIQRQHGREIVIQTGNVEPQRIREVLSQFIPEFTDHHERALDMIIRILKI